MIRRHREFTLALNASLDSMTPQSIDEIAREVVRREQRQSSNTLNRKQHQVNLLDVFSGSRGQSNSKATHSNKRKQPPSSQRQQQFIGSKKKPSPSKTQDKATTVVVERSSPFESPSVEDVILLDDDDDAGTAPQTAELNGRHETATHVKEEQPATSKAMPSTDISDGSLVSQQQQPRASINHHVSNGVAAADTEMNDESDDERAPITTKEDMFAYLIAQYRRRRQHEIVSVKRSEHAATLHHTIAPAPNFEQ